jgi:polysaccharide pyruvyl transferase WcaK-like protein
VRLSDRLGGAPVFSSRDYDMFALVSILRRASFLVSSRYHAIVTTMPALIPSAGIAMDERIRNLMSDRGHDHLRLDCTDPHLGEKLVAVLRTLVGSRQSIRAGIASATVAHLERMAEMGATLLRVVRDRHPGLPDPKRTGAWSALLPPLDPVLSSLLDRRAS